MTVAELKERLERVPEHYMVVIDTSTGKRSYTVRLADIEPKQIGGPGGGRLLAFVLTVGVNL